MISLFSTDFEQTIFSLILILWAFSEVMGGIIIPKLRSRGETIKGKYNRSSRLLYISLISQELFLSYWLDLTLLCCQIGSSILASYSWLSAFSYDNGVFKPRVFLYYKHKCVWEPEGSRLWPISIHSPSHISGILLILIGIGAALQTWGGILIVLMVFGLTIGYRIKIEETFLISEFGDDYIQYMKKTKKLIPFVL